MTGQSRYATCEAATLQAEPGAADQVDIRYLLPRPPTAAVTIPLAWHRVLPDDRLDLLAARYLADATAAWRICDANQALDPEDLVGPDAAGTTLIVPVPQPGG